MTEEWRAIKGYEGIYEVSSLGKVRSLNRVCSNRRQKGRILKTYNRYGKYSTVALCKAGRGKTTMIHTLVASHFIENTYENRCVNHKDGNKHNNVVSNLEWCSYKYNMNHAIDNKLFNRKGENNNFTKLSAQTVINIRKDEDSLSVNELAIKYGTSIRNVRFILKRVTWKHI